MNAYTHTDDGQRWLRIESESDVWDEPASDYEEILDLIAGRHYYRHKRTGAEVKAA